MKIIKLTILISVFSITTLLLTACSTQTVQIIDKNGKSISISSPDSDTYTFKLPSDSSDHVSQAENMINEVTVPEENATVDSDIPSSLPSNGPQTGEP